MHLTDLAYNCIAELQRTTLLGYYAASSGKSYRRVTRFKLGIAINVYIKSVLTINDNGRLRVS